MAKETTKKSVLMGSRVTEKAALQSEARNVFVMNVEKSATKAQVVASIKATHKVVPLAVRFVAVPAKKVFSRGKWGVRSGGKKAYLTLKKGDKIDA